jgi:integrase
MATLTYFINLKGSNLVPVRCKLVSGKNYREMAKSGYMAIPDDWSNDKQLVKGKASATYKDKVNTGLRNLKAHVLNELAKVEGDPGSKWLTETIEKYHNPGKKSKGQGSGLFEFIQKFIDQAPTRLNPKTSRPVCYKMQREYMATFRHLKDFAATKRKKIDFKDITLDFYHDWVAYLQTVNLSKKPDQSPVYMAANTIGKKVQTLKVFLNAASDAGINTNLQYKSHRFKAITEETEHVYLNTDELKAIAEVELNSDLDAIRDLFLIGAWTGLRFSDWNKLKHENIENDLIVIQQQKTRDKVVIPVHEDVKHILDKRGGQLPKVPTNQHMNRALKTIAEKAGITGKEQTTITRGGIERTTSHRKHELIGTHTARRSFATNMYRMGIPTITIMACTGHRTESSFLKYIKVTPEDHAKIILDIWRKNMLRVV